MIPQKMNTQHIKIINRRRVLNALLEKSCATKQEIAQKLAISFPTVSTIIDELTEKGEVNLNGSADSTGGRKAIQYQLNPHYSHTLSIYFHVSTFRYIVSDATKYLAERGTLELFPEGYIHTIKYIISQMTEHYQNIGAITIGVPGGVCNGVIQYIEKYDELSCFALKAEIENTYGIPTSVENDMDAVVWGLYASQFIKIEETIACLYFAYNGPGCGILIDGKPFKGYTGFAGEIGYLSSGKKKQDEMNTEEYIIYIANLITCIAIMINPMYLIIYENSFISTYFDDIVHTCIRIIPPLAMPNIHTSNRYNEHYECGLLESARRLVEDIQDS